MNIFTLFGEIAVNNDQANKAITNTTSKAQSASKKMEKSFDQIGKAAKKCGKAIAAGLAIGGAALTALLKNSIGEFANYEQLVGGVETLFKDSANKVMKYANQAFKTAGLSANDYMETVTSFSASLLQGLGGDTEMAADVANMAITDMADNANKMGTAMSSIQDAYQGFAKQNYTMLDNLKLGYGGTAAEMARLINDSGVLGSAVTVTADTVNQVSFDKIIQAIHVIQDQMGITGTTAKEASDTIAGSFATFKASWTNLLTGLANEDSDMDTLIEQFIGSTETMAANVAKVFPRIKQTIGRVATRLMDEVRTRISAGWNNTVWPFVRDQMRLRFGIELPEDWGAVRQQLDSWWQTASGVLGAVWNLTLASLGFFEFSEEDRQALLTFLNSMREVIVEEITTWFTNPRERLFPTLATLSGVDNPSSAVNTVGNLFEGQQGGRVMEALYWGSTFRESPIGGFANNAFRFALGLPVQVDVEDAQDQLDDANLSVDVQVNTNTQSLGGRIRNWFGNLFGGGDGSTVSNGHGGNRTGDSFANGSHANGLDYVPFDGYRAILHRGESVLTAREAAEWRGGTNGREIASMVASAVRDAVGGIQFNVSLDSGILVGQLTPGIDRQLGSIANRRGRG